MRFFTLALALMFSFHAWTRPPVERKALSDAVFSTSIHQQSESVLHAIFELLASASDEAKMSSDWAIHFFKLELSYAAWTRLASAERFHALQTVALSCPTPKSGGIAEALSTFKRSLQANDLQSVRLAFSTLKRLTRQALIDSAPPKFREITAALVLDFIDPLKRDVLEYPNKRRFLDRVDALTFTWNHFQSRILRLRPLQAKEENQALLGVRGIWNGILRQIY